MMRILHLLQLRLRSLFQKRELDQELDAEMRFHLEQQIQENLAAGMTPEEARYAALRALGGITRIKEECRDQRRLNLLGNLLQDLRYAARTMRRSPAFTLVAVLSLALGIGANTAIFSVVDELMLKRLPVADPDGLLMFSVSSARSAGDLRNFGYRWYEAFRDRAPLFESTAAVADFDESGVTIGNADVDDARQTRVALVSGSYFSLLGVKPALGRALETGDDGAPGANPVAVISHAFWQRNLGGSASAMGQTLVLNEVVYSIVGVAPEGFAGDWIARPADVWIPASMMAQVAPAGADPRMVQIWRILARLKSGAAREQAAAAVSAINLDLRREDAARRHQPPNPNVMSQRVSLADASHGFVPEQKSVAQPLRIVVVVVGLVLLIACANMANLLLARSAARRREIAVRLAFGAGRGRIARQVLTESIALALMGGAIGVLIAQFSTATLLKMVSSALVPIRFETHADARVLGFALLLSLATGAVFGLAPARHAAKTSVTAALAGTRKDGPVKLRLGKLLVISQVALTMVLVVGAGLFLRTLRNLKSQDYGLDQRHLIAIYTAPENGRRKASQGNAYGKLLERLQSLPRVVSVSEIGGSVLDPGYYWIDDSATLRIQGEPIKGGQRVTMSSVGPGFFSTVGAPLLAGRDFNARDARAEAAVAIVNQTFAKFYFGDTSPIGRRVGRPGCQGPACEGQFPYEIVGVVSDINHISPRFQRTAMVYLPMADDAGGRCLVVRTLDAAGPGWGAFLRRNMREAAPQVPILRILTIEQQLDEVLGAERLIAALCSAFGALGLALAGMGLYGVIAYTTARRTREIGVRIALGASRVEVLEMVLKEGLAVVAAGIVVGIPATLAAVKLVAKWMFGVSASDPLTIALAVAMMIAVAALAAWIPARRAASVDPMVALRYE